MSSSGTGADARRADPAGALRTARAWFRAGRRFEMRELAAGLGVNRVTLFRWVGGRDELLGEVLWSLAALELRRARNRTTAATGGHRVAVLLADLARTLADTGYFGEFLRREPERALRVLTTSTTPLQTRVVEVVRRVIDEEIAAGWSGPTLPVPDLAYLSVRIAESFVYPELITGERPDPDKIEQAVTALLR